MAGRPPMFETIEDFDREIDSYFEYIKGEFHYEADPEDESNDIKVWDRHPEPATITGLCLHLGFESRQSFHDYAKNENKPQFSYAIKKARLRIENAYEVSLNYSKNPAAQIFVLKNMGWDDKQQLDHTTGGEKIQATPIVFSKGAREDK